MTIPQRIRTYYDALAQGKHHRYRSWEHCYQFFQKAGQGRIAKQKESAALQLGFYLASWGMLRNSFLLNHTYTVHLGVVDCLGERRFLPLWERDFGANQADLGLVPVILELIQAVRNAYAEFEPKPSNTLVTKVILGTLGCLPACDLYFLTGWRNQSGSYSGLNVAFLKQALQFCSDNRDELRSEQQTIQRSSGLFYPFMKLVDMNFWQLGKDISEASRRTPSPAGQAGRGRGSV